jgi:hypothetical protein
MSVVNNSYLSAFQNQQADLTSQLNELLSKDSVAYETKEKANQLIESVGSIKAFLSGQPVGKFLLKKGSAYVKDLVGAKKETLEDDAEGDPEGIVSEAGEIPNPVFNPTEVESAEGVPDMLASRASALANNYGETSTAIQETSFASGSAIPEGAGAVQGGALEQTLQGGRGLGEAEASQFTQSSSDGVMAGQDELIDNVSRIVKDDASFAKSAVGEGAGEGAGAGAGGELAGEEASVSALDEVPIIGIIGLLAGAGLAIGASLKKPKFKPPVDNINASYQVGI